MLPPDADPELLKSAWDGPDRVDVALAWGHARQHQHTHRVVAALEATDSDDHFDHLAVALELMGDSTAVPALRRLMAAVPANRVGSLAITLGALAPPGPALDWTRADPVERLRRWWTEDRRPELGLADVEHQPNGWLLLRCHGTGRIRIAHPPPLRKRTWARWSKALYVGDRLLYHLSSDCPTCETVLGWCGADAPREGADAVGHALRDLPTLDRRSLDGLEPLLCQLGSDRYIAALCELAVERVDEAEAERSWYFRRVHHREPEDPDWADAYDGSEDTPASRWPGTAHFQLPDRVPTPIPTAVTLLPTQPIDSFDEAVLAERRRAIADGELPAAVGLGWLESRCVLGDYPESFFQVVLLDGHHTLEAWRRQGLPARLVVLCPLSRSWPHQELEAALTLLQGVRPLHLT